MSGGFRHLGIPEVSIASLLQADPDALRLAVERDVCSESLVDYYRAAWPVLEPGTPYLHNWHIDLMCEYLDAFAAGEIRRLAVMMPPRMGKSVLNSVVFPTWVWTRWPQSKWIFSSHTDRLSTGLSVDRRFLIESKWYQERWGKVFRLTSDQNTKILFENDKRGGMYATSVDGAVYGEGSDFNVIDDPLDPKRAGSDAHRERALSHVFRELPTRLNDKRAGRTLLIMQRLHVKDPAARATELGFTALKLQGVAKSATTYSFPRSGRTITRRQNEPMWPEREGLQEHAELRATLGTYDYVAQYDQEPIPAGGKLFDPAIAPVVDAWPPEIVAAVRWWDKAATAGGGDFSAGVLVGVDRSRRYWILDVRRGQWSAAERNQVMRNVAKLDAAQAKRYRYDVVTWVEREGGSGGKESAENTVIDLAGYPVFAEGTTGDKTTYARALAAQWEVRNVSVLNRSWTSAYLDEMGSFPDGSHDDQVDGSSRAFLKLAIRKDPGGYRPGRPRAVANDLTSHLNGYLS